MQKSNKKPDIPRDQLFRLHDDRDFDPIKAFRSSSRKKLNIDHTKSSSVHTRSTSRNECAAGVILSNSSVRFNSLL